MRSILTPLMCSATLVLAAATAPENTSPALRRVQQQLGSAVPITARNTDVRRQLDDILARPEFSQTVRTPTAFKRFLQWLGEWIRQLLARLFRAAAQHPTTSEIIFWVLGVAALCLIAWLLFRLFRRDEATLTKTAATQDVPRQDADVWMHSARSAFERGETSEAIQCLYWASVTWLQHAGRLPTTIGLTPRELLRAAQTDWATVRDLGYLTSAMERFWYGRQLAVEGDFAACMRAAEALGCKAD